MNLQDIIEQHMRRAITATKWYRRKDIVLPISAEELYLITHLAEWGLAEHPELAEEYAKDLEEDDENH